MPAQGTEQSCFPHRFGPKAMASDEGNGFPVSVRSGRQAGSHGRKPWPEAMFVRVRIVTSPGIHRSAALARARQCARF
jgi:hypothetical protein